MLDTTLGPGKALARVQADINVDQTTRNKTSYAKKGTPLQTQTSKEVLASTGGGTVTPAGTATTTTPAATTTSTGPNSTSNYQNQSGTTSFGVDKTVQTTVVAPGSVAKLDVALLIDSSVPKAEVAGIKKSVASLAGIVPSRGDTLSVTTLAFAKPPAVATAAATGGIAGLIANPLNLAKYVALGLGTLLFLFFMSRSIKRRERDGIAPEPTWYSEISRAAPVRRGFEASRRRGELNPAAQHAAALKAEASEIATRQPEQVAQQVGAWLKE